jgi:hypothetical protein
MLVSDLDTNPPTQYETAHDADTVSRRHGEYIVPTEVLAEELEIVYEPPLSSQSDVPTRFARFQVLHLVVTIVSLSALTVLWVALTPGVAAVISILVSIGFVAIVALIGPTSTKGKHVDLHSPGLQPVAQAEHFWAIPTPTGEGGEGSIQGGGGEDHGSKGGGGEGGGEGDHEGGSESCRTARTMGARLAAAKAATKQPIYRRDPDHPDDPLSRRGRLHHKLREPLRYIVDLASGDPSGPAGGEGVGSRGRKTVGICGGKGARGTLVIPDKPARRER